MIIFELKTGYRRTGERVDVVMFFRRPKKRVDTVEGNFSETCLVREIGIDAVGFTVDEHRDSPAFLGQQRKGRTKVVDIDVFGDDALNTVSIFPDRKGNR